MTLPGFFTGTGMPDPGWWSALWPDPARVLAQLGMRPGGGAIDLCCGDGWFTLPMARAAVSVFALDLDTRLLAVARARLDEAGLANCCFLEADAYQIAAVVPKPADFVLLANVVHGVPDQPRLVRAIGQSLKPGGIFAVVNWHAWPRRETVVLGEPRGPASELRLPPEATIAAVEPSGFDLVALAEVSPYHYGMAFRRPG